LETSSLKGPAAIWLAVIEVFLVLLLRFGSSFPGWDSVVLFAGLVAGSWLLGSFARRWQTMAAENAQRAMELEEARIELAQSAVAAERLRIARELHDVVAHSMSVIAMHAGAARLAVGTDPASERAALDVIERSSRGALGEMRRLVTLLRDENAAELGRSPAPRLTELHTLVADVVAVGLTVDVRTEGNLNTVPPGISLAAYRIIQEALTNIVRHAGLTRATLLVKAGTDELTIRVVNAPPSTSSERADPAGGRHGSIGMRERVVLYGGTLSAGPTADGGWLWKRSCPMWWRNHDQSDDRGRSAPCPRRPSIDLRPRRRHHRGRRRQRWSSGGSDRTRAASGCDLDGHPNADHGRHRGDTDDHR